MTATQLPLMPPVGRARWVVVVSHNESVDEPDAAELKRRLDDIVAECENANSEAQTEDVRGWIPAALVLRLARGEGYL